MTVWQTPAVMVKMYSMLCGMRLALTHAHIGQNLTAIFVSDMPSC